MKENIFEIFFEGDAERHLYDAITLALREDGEDLTSAAVFGPSDTLAAEIRAKSKAVVAGLPLLPIILRAALPERESLACAVVCCKSDGDNVLSGELIASIQGGARRILKAERVILNFICHLSGIATLTASYVKELEGIGITLLDTRKTHPGLRYPEKYAVLIGGGRNHRKNLAEMLMLKDNHIDAAGSITRAVDLARRACAPCPPIEVECRTVDEVREALACSVERIMFDNMGPDEIQASLALVPEHIETEISGGVTRENIRRFCCAGGKTPTFISVGRLTHSASSADFSMRITKENP